MPSDITECIYDFYVVYNRFLDLPAQDFHLFKSHLEDLIVYGNKFLLAVGEPLSHEARYDLEISLGYSRHILTEFRAAHDYQWTRKELLQLKALITQFFEDVILSDTMAPAFSRISQAS